MPFYNISYPELRRYVLSIAIFEVSLESIQANLNVIGPGMLLCSSPHGFPQQLDIMSRDPLGVGEDFAIRTGTATCTGQLSAERCKVILDHLLRRCGDSGRAI